MRDLIEEFMLLAIALIVAGILVATFLFDFYVPEIGKYVEAGLPEQNMSHVDFEALSATIVRKAPIITASNIASPYGDSVDFNMYVTNGTIRAVNADGVDVSGSIHITPLDDAARLYYDEKNNIFKDAPVGEYQFVITACDVDGSVNYGKEQSKIITVVIHDIV